MGKIDRDYCFQDNKDFMTVALPGGMAIVRRKDDAPELQECLQHPEKLLDKADILKDSRTTTAGVVKLLKNKEVFIKRFNNKGLAYSLKYMFREARPFRVWRAAWALEKAGIPTPRPMAALAKYNCGFPGNAYLIRNVVPDIVPTLDFFIKVKESEELQKSYIQSIALMFAKMHDAGIYHGDAKCSNIYVEACGKDKFAYGVWDLLSCRFGNNPISKTFREKEISRIAWSFTEIFKRLGAEVDKGDIKAKIMHEYMRR
ncbi:MAG: hypothetical protein AUJ72_04305 [Candidatus Omnitrophica bacterium CG1_02_46_14]|nr:MAG: hypothetical protein AUJ72_04305 [Candidatus Omnitrophica bacterium CG1_02_46_14]